MHLDGFFFNSLIAEINSQVSGSRVEDIYSTEGGNLLMQFRAPGRTLRLEISVHTSPFSLFLTEQGRRAKTSGTFPQTLKKYLAGLFCTSVHNPPFDRRAVLSFSSAPHGRANAFVHIEIMGRHNDVILCQEDTITASTRPSRRERDRNLQPGDRYAPPPPAAKVLPQDISADILQTMFMNIGAQTVGKALVKSIFGLSPLLAQEICQRAEIDSTNPAASVTAVALAELTRAIHTLASASLEGIISPALYPGGPYWTKLRHLPNYSREFSNLSAALDYWNDKCRAGSGAGALKTKLQAAVSGSAGKLRRTIAKQELELKKAEDYQHLRQIGDTLLAGMHAIPRGATQVTLDNVHTGQTMTITLDPEKSASSNASYYYKRYNKYKNAQTKVLRQIKINMSQLDYLESLEYALDSASTLPDLLEIMQEMQEQGLLRSQSKTKSRPKLREDYLSYSSPRGDLVLVGKNNRQNEILTLKKADKDHYWLHTRHCPGSHVILCNPDPQDSALEFAASLAAWHSKAQSSPKVEVVWTKVKNVKKIPGAKPGMVQYTDYHSVLIQPCRHSTGEEPE